MPYTIGEVARMMNIAPSTLRYYEKEGLLSLGVRASNGQRTYTDDDIATLSIIEYLKFCGLPLKEIRSFLPLIRPGGETLSARRDILAKERDNVRAQIAALQTKLERLEFGAGSTRPRSSTARCCRCMNFQRNAFRRSTGMFCARAFACRSRTCGQSLNGEVKKES